MIDKPKLAELAKRFSVNVEFSTDDSLTLYKEGDLHINPDTVIFYFNESGGGVGRFNCSSQAEEFRGDFAAAIAVALTGQPCIAYLRELIATIRKTQDQRSMEVYKSISGSARHPYSVISAINVIQSSKPSGTQELEQDHHSLVCSD